MQSEPLKREALAAASPTMANGRALEALVARDGGLIGGGSRTLGVLCVRTTGAGDIMGPAAAAVSAATRIADLIFKPTEDSLVVLMPDCDPGSGRLIMERIAAAVPPGVVPPPAIASPIRLAFACSPFDGESVRDLLRTAQRRLDNWDEPTVVGMTAPVLISTALQHGERPW